MQEDFSGVFWVVLNALFTREVHRPFERCNIVSHKRSIKGPQKDAQNLHKEALVFELYLKTGNDRFYKIAGVGEFFHDEDISRCRSDVNINRFKTLYYKSFNLLDSFGR